MMFYSTGILYREYNIVLYMSAFDSICTKTTADSKENYSSTIYIDINDINNTLFNHKETNSVCDSNSLQVNINNDNIVSQLSLIEL